MKVSAFTYVRNGFNFDYPFLQSIQSVLPVVDEFIVVVGDSFDETRDSILALNDVKIKIVDTVWDEQMRAGGYIFAQQANIGLDNVSKDADWVFHIQADEVIHEKDYPTITKAMKDNLADKSVDGFLFNFLNFFGDYRHYAPSRRYHQKEIRVVRNNPNIRSYRDSQGFRIFNDPANAVNEKGKKLMVKKIDATVYHYSYVKRPETQFKKHVEFGNRWEPNDDWIEEMIRIHPDGFDYSKIDYLKLFKGTHPAIMHPKLHNRTGYLIIIRQ
ncbi:MAG: glycosyltransferase family 2 protein [Chitinophagaceae bacterium]|nr:glycosyltransferase family 2 protein [Chitinophagaceae bacterium]